MPGRKIGAKGFMKKNITPFFVPVFCRSITVDTSFYQYIAGKNSHAGEYDWADASLVLLDPRGDEGNEAATSVDLDVAYRLLLTLNNYNSLNIKSTLGSQRSLEKTISKITENHISRLYMTNASDYFELRSILKEIKELYTLKQLPARKLTKKLRSQIDLRSENIKSKIFRQLSVLEKGADNSILQKADTSGKQKVSSVMSTGYSRIISQHQKVNFNRANTVHISNISKTFRGYNPLIYEKVLTGTVQNISKAVSPLYRKQENISSLNNEEILTYNVTDKRSYLTEPHMLKLYGYKTAFTSIIDKTMKVVERLQTANGSEKTAINWLQFAGESTSGIFKQQVNSRREIWKLENEKYHETVIKEERKQRNYRDTVLRSINERIETSTQTAANELIKDTVYGTDEYTQMVLKQTNEYEKRASEEEKWISYLQRETARTGKNVIFHSIMNRLGKFITVHTGKAGNSLTLCEVKKTTELYNTLNSTAIGMKHNEPVNLNIQTVFEKRINSTMLKTWGNSVFQGVVEYSKKNNSLNKKISTLNLIENDVQEEERVTFWRNFSKSTELVKNDKTTMLQSILEKFISLKRITAFDSRAHNRNVSAVQSNRLNQFNNENSSGAIFNEFSVTVLSPARLAMNSRQTEGLVKEIIEKKASGFIKKIYNGSNPLNTFIENNSELTFYKESKSAEAFNRIIENNVNETIKDKPAAEGRTPISLKEQNKIALFERVLEKNALWLLKNFSSITKSVRDFTNIQNGRGYLKLEKNVVNLNESLINSEIAYYKQNTAYQLLSLIKNTVNGEGSSISDSNKLERNSYVFAKSGVTNNGVTAFSPDKKTIAGKSLKTMEGTINNVSEKNIFKEIISRKQFTEMIHSHGEKSEIEYSRGFAGGADIEHVKKVSHKNNEQLELQEKTIKGLAKKLEAQTELVKNLYEKQDIKIEKPVDIRDITNNVMRQLQKELRLERQRRGLE